MNYKLGMRALLLFIAVSAAVKIGLLLDTGAVEKSLYSVAATIWAVWVTIAVFRNWSLPAPFGFHDGTNQGPRIAYCVFVNGIFVFAMIFI